MQPTICSKCKKNVAVVFISRMNEKGEPVNEGLCLKCAAELKLPQVEDMMRRMGITPEDLEGINTEMMQAFGGAEELEDGDYEDESDEESGKTATFPFLNQLFGNNPPIPKEPHNENNRSGRSKDAQKGTAEFCVSSLPCCWDACGPCNALLNFCDSQRSFPRKRKSWNFKSHAIHPFIKTRRGETK